MADSELLSYQRARLLNEQQKLGNFALISTASKPKKFSLRVKKKSNVILQSEESNTKERFGQSKRFEKNGRRTIKAIVSIYSL